MELENTLCLGVAGNFAHHLAQAGELKDFENIITKEQNAPKGIFPFYIPHSQTPLGIYSISPNRLDLVENEKIQVEPEIAIFFEIEYDKTLEVKNLKAKKFTTFNDTTIRKEGARKISDKKSWGENSKGIGKSWIKIDDFNVGGIMDDYHLCSFVKREGILYEYGVDAPLLGYSYFYQKLIDWLIDRLNHQKDFGVLENITTIIKACNYPKTVLVSIGATAYTQFGEENYLQKGDEIYVVAYDKRVDNSSLEEGEHKIILHQKVQ